MSDSQSGYRFPEVTTRKAAGAQDVIVLANGDLRSSANVKCWPAQKEMEAALEVAIKGAGCQPTRGHEFDRDKGHGFIDSQRMGMDVFARIDPKARLIVAEAVWQYSHHLLHGLITHEGPILNVANWSGTWPGLVGILNLNGSLTKAGVKYSTLWSEDFGDAAFGLELAKWLRGEQIVHNQGHVTSFEWVTVHPRERDLGVALAGQLMRDKAILGVFDEGCMGMYNAIIPDELLSPVGVYKERLSQSALYYETTQVGDDEAKAVYDWLVEAGMKFHTGAEDDKHLTEKQILWQCKMYIAALRIADDFGCATIGIQYQQGLKDLLPASDLVEGMLNNTDRPPVRSRDGKRVLYKDVALPHFNEVDECAGLDGLMTHRIHQAMGQPVENTLHDLRWGDWDQSNTTDQYVWVFLISGSAPPAHFKGGWQGATGERQPAMYFPRGGSTLKGISKPGEIVWSRVYIEGGVLKMDLGRAGVIDLPETETQRRWEETTSQWPIMHAVTYGVSRDQMIGRHKSNHIQVAYANSAEEADMALHVKACMAKNLGMVVSVCGTNKDGKSWT